MPEGMDIFTLSNWLQSTISGKDCKLIVYNNDQIINNFETQIISISSKGKLLIIKTNLSENGIFAVHFGLEGNLKETHKTKSWLLKRHGRHVGKLKFSLIFPDFIQLDFYESTGSNFKFISTKELNDELDKLGPDAMSESQSALYNHLKSMTLKIKNQNLESIFTNQEVISGLGKRWRSGAFSKAKIDPKTKFGKLSDHDLQHLIYHIEQVGKELSTQQSKLLFDLHR